MTEKYEFDSRDDFLAKLNELVESGVPKRKINTFTPYPVHEIEHLLDDSQSPVRFFTGGGAITGLIAGFAFTIGTVLAWPQLITGGKPLVSIPAFLIIGYELTILFGCLFAFNGFLLLSRTPSVTDIFSNREFSRKFQIVVSDEDRR
jgi:hypothetical protein